MTIVITQPLATSKSLEDEHFAHVASVQEVLNQKRQVSADALFAGGKEVTIVHGAEEYMLRITKQGKLILTK
jgi:hemin uptake protein HemP